MGAINPMTSCQFTKCTGFVFDKLLLRFTRSTHLSTYIFNISSLSLKRGHFFHGDVLGLRCHIAVHCHFWRWTHPQADLSSSGMNCQVQKGKKCRHARCEIFTREGRPWCQKPATGSLEKGSSPKGLSHLSYVAGDKRCYKQVLGANNGCFRQDLSYREDEVKLQHANGVFWKYGLQTTNHAEGVYLNWGACALKCKGSPPCRYWTWASPSCSDCFPETCFLYDKLDDAEELKLYEHRGHISGEVECQDISYIEGKAKEVQNSLGSAGPEWKTGACQSSGGTKPFCPSQAVPGYKWVVAIIVSAAHKMCEREMEKPRWAVERSYAYDRRWKVMAGMCKYWCLQLYQVHL